MPNICVGELGQYYCMLSVVACQAPSHYLNRCWLNVNWAFRDKLKWNSNGNTKLFIHNNAFENVFAKMAAVSSSVWWVNKWYDVSDDHYQYRFCFLCRILLSSPIHHMIQRVVWGQTGVRPLSVRIKPSILTHIYASLRPNESTQPSRYFYFVCHHVCSKFSYTVYFL